MPIPMGQEGKMKLFDDTVASMREILETKGIEYSSDNDGLATFRNSGMEAIGLKPEQVALVYLEKHMAAIRSYVRHGTEFSDESIYDRIHDAMNYLFLLRCLIVEKKAMGE